MDEKMVADRWLSVSSGHPNGLSRARKKRDHLASPTFLIAIKLWQRKGGGVPSKVDSGELVGDHWWAAALGKVTRGALQCPGYHARGGKAR